MSAISEMIRHADAAIDEQFLDRWSPRSFSPTPLTANEIESLFEAARWAPSCYNEQPWRFYYAISESARQKFVEILVSPNQKWACNAPLLILLAVEKQFARTGKPNRHAPYDAGAAWMSLALQARKMGLYSHAMAGFYKDKAIELLGLDPEKYEVMTAIAVGNKADINQLPENLQNMESPNTRMTREKIAFEFE